jgi:alkanesulfonate monooxygenase SsuD/methylene tetrahydromethanopterin reductase-like flavin-dependent oxidoreductase (luciferase family)
VAKDRAEAEAALKRAAQTTNRTVEVSRTPGEVVKGSHVLSYAGTPGGTEANALYDTADNIVERLDVLRSAGVAYVLITTLGGSEQLRRFARDVMPALAEQRAPAELAQAPSGGA